MAQKARASGKAERPFPYHIHLLDHDLLIDLERQVERGKVDVGDLEEARTVVSFYRQLLSNSPRRDHSVRLVYGVQNVGMDEAVENELRKDEDLTAQRTGRKAEAALWLYRKGYYSKSAEVNAECADDVMALASGRIDRHWLTSRDKNVRAIDPTARNAGSYDLVVRFGKPFMKMSLGYIDLEAGIYAENLV